MIFLSHNYKDKDVVGPIATDWLINMEKKMYFMIRGQ